MTLEKLLEISQREGDRKFIEAEQRRIEPYAFEEYQQYQVKQDMKAWAVKNGHWPNEVYGHMIVLHAMDRGWTQPYFTGMEMPHDA